MSLVTISPLALLWAARSPNLRRQTAEDLIRCFVPPSPAPTAPRKRVSPSPPTVKPSRAPFAIPVAISGTPALSRPSRSPLLACLPRAVSSHFLSVPFCWSFTISWPTSIALRMCSSGTPACFAIFWSLVIARAAPAAFIPLSIESTGKAERMCWMGSAMI